MQNHPDASAALRQIADSNQPFNIIIVQPGTVPGLDNLFAPPTLPGEPTIGAEAAVAQGVFWEEVDLDTVNSQSQEIGESDDRFYGNFHFWSGKVVNGRDAILIRFLIDWKFGTPSVGQNGFVRAFGANTENPSKIGRFAIGEAMFVDENEEVVVIVDPLKAPYDWYGVHLAPATAIAGDASVSARVLRRASA